MPSRWLSQLYITWHYCLDALFPPSPQQILIRRQTSQSFLTHLRPFTAHQVIVLSSYRDPVIKAAIATLKFERTMKSARLLASLVAHWLATLPPQKTWYIPIPLHPQRMRQRGFNQVHEVLRNISPLPSESRIVTNLLQRTKNTRPQTALGRTERLENVTGAFLYQPIPPSDFNEIKRIIIFDDVLTTGATMEAARATLASHLPPHIELICVAWAH